MKFKNSHIYCTKCGKKYDKFARSCPNCHTINKFNFDKPGQNGIVWMDSLRQILIFLVGFIGFQIFGLIVSSILIAIYGKEVIDGQIIFSIPKESILMANNALSYLLVFICIFIIAYPYLHDVFHSFLDGKNLIFGVGFGILLILSSIIYGALISLIPGIGDTQGNDNQMLVSNLTTMFPLPALLLFGIVGPLCEEFTYRVGAFSFFNRISRLLAYILTILIFGFIHFNFDIRSQDQLINELVNIPSYIIAGVILCFAYEKGSFACSTIAHIVNNTYSVIMILFMNIISQA